MFQQTGLICRCPGGEKIARTGPGLRVRGSNSPSRRVRVLHPRCYTQVEHRRFSGPKGRHSLCRWCQPPDDCTFSLPSHERSAASPPIARGNRVKGNPIPVPDGTGKGCISPPGLPNRLVYNNKAFSPAKPHREGSQNLGQTIFVEHPRRKREN